MKRLLILGLLVLAMKCQGQSLDPRTSKLYDKLYSFLIEKGELPPKEKNHYPQIGVFSLLDSSRNVGIGIYTFNAVSSNAVPYLFFNYSNRVVIISDYSPEELLQQLVRFYRKNPQFKYDEKLKYIRNLESFMRLRDDIIVFLSR